MRQKLFVLINIVVFTKSGILSSRDDYIQQKSEIDRLSIGANFKRMEKADYIAL